MNPTSNKPAPEILRLIQRINRKVAQEHATIVVDEQHSPYRGEGFVDYANPVATPLSMSKEELRAATRGPSRLATWLTALPVTHRVVVVCSLGTSIEVFPVRFVYALAPSNDTYPFSPALIIPWYEKESTDGSQSN